MGKLYVVMKIDFDYNDEIYHTTESEGGHPQKAFKKKLNAETYCEALNIEKLKGSDLGSYAYDMDEIMNAGNSEEALSAILKPTSPPKATVTKPDPTCRNCSSPFWNEQALFCSICGNKRGTFVTTVKKPTRYFGGDDFHVPEDISDENAKKLLSMLNLRFFKVVEIETE